MAPAQPAECVRVVVRCRPLNSKESAEGRARIVDVDAGARSVSLRAPAPSGDAPKAFTFDATFDCGAAQRDVYDNAAAAIVNSVLSGYNGTVFAYGQTGTGKTHTMEGTPDDPGIIPSAFDHIFGAIQGSENKQYLVRASFLEIYNEEVRDLLSKSPKEKLEVKEHKDSGVYVKGLNAFVVKSVPEIRNVLEVRAHGRMGACMGACMHARMRLPAVHAAACSCARLHAHACACMGQCSSRLMCYTACAHAPSSITHTQVGKKNRSVGATLMNQDSSRSHSVFTITVECIEQGPAAVSVCVCGGGCCGCAGCSGSASRECPATAAAAAGSCTRPASSMLYARPPAHLNLIAPHACTAFIPHRTATSVWASSTWWTWRAASDSPKRAPQVCAPLPLLGVTVIR